MRRTYLLVAPLVVTAAACAKHVPDPTPHPSTPHITWSIAQGYGGEKEVCRSTVVSPCTLDMSGVAQNRRFAVFHLFLHAASTDTKYKGTVDIGFLGQPGEAKHTHSIDRTVLRGSDSVNFSTTGIVKPAGTYYVDISLTATPVSGSGPTVPFQERIRVDVK